MVEENMSQLSNPQHRPKGSNDDYCSYVTKIEKSLSIYEGPHFPNLGGMFATKEERRGIFGQPEHMEEFANRVTVKVAKPQSGGV